MKLHLYATHHPTRTVEQCSNYALTLLLARKRRHQTACTALPRTRFVSHWIHPANILSSVRELRFEHEEHDWLPGFLVWNMHTNHTHTHSIDITHTHTYCCFHDKNEQSRNMLDIYIYFSTWLDVKTVMIAYWLLLEQWIQSHPAILAIKCENIYFFAVHLHIFNWDYENWLANHK